MELTAIQRNLMRMAALLFGVGMLTGIWSAAALSDTVHVAIPHLALAAHLNGLFGALWIIAVAVTLPFMSYNQQQQQRLSALVLVPAWANYAVTLVASFLGVRGINYTQDMTNNVIAFLLQVLVVIPSLAASFYWFRGFQKK